MVTIFLMQGSGPQPVTVHAVARLMRPLITDGPNLAGSGQRRCRRCRFSRAWPTVARRNDEADKRTVLVVGDLPPFSLRRKASQEGEIFSVQPGRQRHGLRAP